MSCKKYFFVMFGVVVVVVGGVGVMNYFVDPYGVFGVNRLGIYALHSEDVIKCNHLKKHGKDYDWFLVGDSRCNMIDVGGVGVGSMYNASLGGAKAEELYYYVREYIPDGKKLIWGLLLGQGSHGGRRFGGMSWEEKYTRYLLSAKAAELSFRTIKNYLRGKPARMKENGSLDNTRWRAMCGVNDEPRHKALVREFREGIICNSAFREEDMEYYDRIAGLVREKSLELYVFIHPVHEEILDGLEGMECYVELEKWREYIKRVFPEVVDLSESKYSRRDNFLSLDLVHYRSEAGEALLRNEILPLFGGREAG